VTITTNPIAIGGDAPSIGLSGIIGALSLALDLTEGQPPGHAARTCILGMRMARELALPTRDQGALYYALLLKDLGCSSNAAKMSYLFGADDRNLKRDVKTIDWQRMSDRLKYAANSVKPGAGRIQRVLGMASLALQGAEGPRQLIKIRCERGASVARSLGLAESTAQAILDLDEHWNGKGHPHGKSGTEISLFGRILGICQTAEVFWRESGLVKAIEVVRERSGRWFDPGLVNLFNHIANDKDFCQSFLDANPQSRVGELEPVDEKLIADEATIDRIASAFSDVIDAKSPWTFRHSRGVADIAGGMAGQLGFAVQRTNELRRVALLHDLGKLGVSNLILDKPGKLTDDEFAAMKLHPRFSEEILAQVDCFRHLAPIAGSHHERLDGRGYFRGISSATLEIESRVLMVADVFEALTAARPYRDALPVERVLGLLEKDVGVAVCPVALRALNSWLEHQDFASRVEAQHHALESLLNGLSPCGDQSCDIPQSSI
jgi:HD-GYP domain-containing protein (c-di-GMP phosphodiesterase class II)